ncbi:UNVERIFIED_CONTAM: hypothetical protein FKN15_011553 [Acipenser sinensis]
MAWALKLPLSDEVIESGLVQDFDASLSGIGQELGAGAYSMRVYYKLDQPQCVQNLLPTATPQEAQQWLLRNRFSSFCRLFNNFSGTDLLKLTREDVIQICGPADGIRLFNAVKGRVVRPRLTIYVCQESQQTREQQKHENGDAAGGTFFVYHAIYLEELTAAELTEKIAQLFSISPQQISQIYKQGPTGIHVLVCDEMLLNFQDESCFILDTMKASSASAGLRERSQLLHPASPSTQTKECALRFYSPSRPPCFEALWIGIADLWTFQPAGFAASSRSRSTGILEEPTLQTLSLLCCCC